MQQLINISNLKDYLNFLWAMTEKEFKARYKRAVFGFLWVVLNPILQMLIIGLIFSFFIKIPNYFLFLFTGLLLWMSFSLSVSKATSSIAFEHTLLQKAKFPIEVIPISIILSNFLHTLVSLLLLILFLIITGKLVFPQILLVIPALAWFLAFVTGFSMFTATLQVRFRDISFFVQSLLVLWFYATPVIYDLRSIPVSFRFIYMLNPLASIFELFRLSILNQGLIDYRLIIANLFLTFVTIGLGAFFFRKMNKYFVDWL